MRERRFFKNAEAQKHTVNDLIDRYEEKLKREKPKRYKDAKQMLKWWRDQIGIYVLADVNRALISQTIDKLTKRTVKRADKVIGEAKEMPISAGRLNRYIFAISPAFTMAVNEWEWMDENPFMKIKKFKEPRGRVRFLDDDERERLLEVCKETSYEHLYLIVVLALSTGARKGEILGLRWQDIDWERKQFVLHETKNSERRVIRFSHHGTHFALGHA